MVRTQGQDKNAWVGTVPFVISDSDSDKKMKNIKDYFESLSITAFIFVSSYDVPPTVYLASFSCKVITGKCMNDSAKSVYSLFILIYFYF